MSGSCCAEPLGGPLFISCGCCRDALICRCHGLRVCRSSVFLNKDRYREWWSVHAVRGTCWTSLAVVTTPTCRYPGYVGLWLCSAHPAHAIHGGVLCPTAH